MEASETVAGLDPRLNHFILDLNALVLWEKNTGRTIEQFNEKSMEDLRLLMWCGMKTQIPDLTLEQVGSMMTPRNAKRVTAFILGSLVEALPEAEAKNEEPRPIG
jgi:hypothetical protein